MFKKTNLALALFSLAALWTMSFKPDSSGGKAGYSGAPNESNCTSCHTGTANTGGGSILIGSNIPTSGYVAGTVYQMTVTVAQAQKPLFGFDLTALNSTGANAGTLAVTNTAETQILASGGRNNMTHKTGAGASTSGSKTFTFNWTAPAASVGVVSFYAAGNAADGTGGTTGDNIYTISKTFSPATVAPVITITGNTNLCASSTPNVACTTLTATASPAGNYTYAWSNGATSASDTLCQTVTTTYTVSVTLNNVVTTKTATVTVNPAPVPTMTGSSAVCAGASAQIGVGSATGATFTSYIWNTQATTQIITVTPTATTTYVATVTDANGCTASATRTVTVNNRPVPIISGSDVVCLGQTAQIGVATSAGGSFTAYQWSTQATTATITPTPTTTTIYTVTVTNATGCTASATRIITVNPLPAVAVTQSGSLCTGAVALTATGGGTYAWSIVGASGATASVAAAGIYTVTATSTLGCAKAATITVAACTPTSIVFTGNTTPCVGACTAITASIPNNTSVLTYTWSNNLGTGATKQICLTTPPTALTYTVTATNATGTIVGSGSVTVSPATTTAASITGTAAVCAGGTTTLSANPSTTGFTYLWNNAVTTRNITVMPTANAIYTCTVTNLSGCTSSASFGVTVNPAPVITITRGAALCGNNATTLTATGTAGTNNTFLWNNAATSAAITVTAAGTYTVTVTNANGCTASKTFALTQTTPPAFTITEIGSLCSPNGMSLTATAAAGTTNTYLWSTQAIGNTITFNTAGVYSVTATNNDGCTTSRSFTATQPAPPTAAIAQSGTLCSPNGVLMTATGGATYEWSTGSLIATSNTTAAGIYTVYVTNAAGCTASATTVVAACANITVAITGDARVCAAATPGTTGGCTLLTATATGSTSATYTYMWSSQATTAAFNTCPTATTTYTVTATASTGATATASWTVTVNPAPVVTITQGAALCGNNATTLTATGGGTYSWGAVSGSAVLTVTAAGTYTVTVTSALGCTATKSIVVTQSTVPTLAITQTGTLCPPNTTTLTASTGFATYVWSNNMTSRTDTIQTAGTYTVTATTQAGCSRTTSLTVAPCASIAVSITGDNRLCAPTAGTTACIPLTATATGAAAPATYTYAWSNQTMTAIAQVCPTTTTTYTVTATASTGATATATWMVTVNPAPVVTITQGAPLCGNNATTLTATGGGTYSWGAVSGSAVLTVTAAGTYTVTVTSALGCTATKSIVVTQSTVPTLAITQTGTLCPPNTTTLTASTGFATYVWSNNMTSRTDTIQTAGTYTVTATTQAGCSRTTSLSVAPCASIAVSITGDLRLCANPTAATCTALTATATGAAGTAYTYIWSNQMTTNVAQVCLTATTTYTVTATASTGATATASWTVTLNPAPIATVTGNTVLTCSSPVATITVTSNIANSTFMWSNASTTPTVSITAAGTYTVTITAPTTCTATKTVVITSNFTPSTATVTSTGNLTCSRVSTVLTAAANGLTATYLWSNAATTANITVTAPGTYTVTITNPTNGCTASATVAVTQNVVAPIITISGGLEFCAGNTTTLTATVSNGNATFMWNSAVISPTITMQTGGTYTVTATSAANGCTATKSATVVVKARPVVTITQPTIPCAGLATSLLASGGGTYLWNTQATTASVTIAASTAAAATYTVTVTGANACTATATKKPQYLSGINCTPTGGGGGTARVAANMEPISLYPNPTENNFNLVFGEQDWLDATITVTDVAGKTITTIQKSFIASGETMAFETANWVSGVYFITIENKTKRQSLKVVKVQ